jgi:hypothetical protein
MFTGTHRYDRGTGQARNRNPHPSRCAFVEWRGPGAQPCGRARRQANRSRPHGGIAARSSRRHQQFRKNHREWNDEERVLCQRHQFFDRTTVAARAARLQDRLFQDIAATTAPVCGIHQSHQAQPGNRSLRPIGPRVGVLPSEIFSRAPGRSTPLSQPFIGSTRRGLASKNSGTPVAASRM